MKCLGELEERRCFRLEHHTSPYHYCSPPSITPLEWRWVGVPFLPPQANSLFMTHTHPQRDHQDGDLYQTKAKRRWLWFAHYRDKPRDRLSYRRLLRSSGATTPHSSSWSFLLLRSFLLFLAIRLAVWYTFCSANTFHFSVSSVRVCVCFSLSLHPHTSEISNTLARWRAV